MPYMNPGAAASDAIEQAMVRRMQEQRQAAQDAIQQRQMALQEQRETRAAADQDEMMQFRRDEAGQRAEAAGLDKHMKRLALMKPGDIPDAQMIAESKKYGTSSLMGQDPSMNIPAGKPQVQLPGGDGSTDSPIGPDGQPVANLESNVIDMPGAANAQTIPGAVRFGGLPAQRDELQKQAMRKSLADSIDSGADARTVIGGYLRNGGDPAEAEKIVAALKDKSKAAIRVSPDKGTVEIRNEQTGGWDDLRGPIPEGATILQQAQPHVGSGNDEALNLDGRGLDMAAKMYAKTGNLPATGMGGAAGKIAIIKRAADFNEATDSFDGDAPIPDIAFNKADYAMNSQALKTIGTNIATVDAFVRTAEKNTEKFKKILDSVPDHGSSWLNMPARAFASGTGDVNMAKFNTFLSSLQSEYARILNQANINNVLAVSSVQEAKHMLSKDATVAQLLGTLESLHEEALSRKEGYNEEKGLLSSAIKHTPQEAETPKALPTAGMTPEQKKAYYLDLANKAAVK